MGHRLSTIYTKTSNAGETGISDKVRLPKDEITIETIGDLGFSPFELVGAGLGACTSMTMRLYANRKDWPMAGTQVVVTWEQADRHITTFRRRIALDGDLSDDQRVKLIEIANKCPVHRMLVGEVTIDATAE